MPFRPFSFKIQDHINHGWTVEARKLGTRWDVIRLKPVTGYTVQAVDRLYRVNHFIDTKQIEFAAGSWVYRARGDRAILQVNDQLQGKETVQKEEEPTTLERYTVASLRILWENIIVRTDEACKVYRPTQRSTTGVQAVSSYNYEAVRNARIGAYDKVAGTWGFIDQALVTTEETTVYIGFTLGGEGKFGHDQDLPYSVPDSGWLATMGFFTAPKVFEGDIIVDPDNNFYRVDKPYPTFEGAFLQQNWCTRVRH